MTLIQMRRGNEADFDPTKMLPGEWAVSLDTKYVRMCFAPGYVRKMATYEAFEEDVKEVTILVEEAKEAATGITEQVDSAKAYSEAANLSKLAAQQSAADSLASANQSQEQARLAQNS